MCFQITWDLCINRHVFSLQILTSARKKTFVLFIPNVQTLLVLTLVNVFLDTSCTMVFVMVRCNLQLILARSSSHKNFLNSLVPSTRELEMHESRWELLKLAIETCVHFKNPLPKSNRLCKPDFNRVVATWWNWSLSQLVDKLQQAGKIVDLQQVDTSTTRRSFECRIIMYICKSSLYYFLFKMWTNAKQKKTHATRMLYV